jgi:hypothetical protein
LRWISEINRATRNENNRDATTRNEDLQTEKKEDAHQDLTINVNLRIAIQISV